MNLKQLALKRVVWIPPGTTFSMSCDHSSLAFKSLATVANIISCLARRSHDGNPAACPKNLFLPVPAYCSLPHSTCNVPAMWMCKRDPSKQLRDPISVGAQIMQSPRRDSRI